MPKVIKIILLILLCNFVGAVGSYFTFSSISNWYVYLNKPFFNPPNYLFGPVWTLLYTLMGISAFLAWKNKKAMKYFWIQLFLNGIWTPIFFGARNLGLAFIVIVVLLVYIVKTIQAFAKVNKTASYLLYPYLAWVSFASLLNFTLWYLN